MIREPMPTTEQIRAYLTAHDWRPGWAIGSVGAMYVYRELSDDGNPLTVFVPASEAFDDYTQRVLDIADSLRVLERRDREAVLADMLATDPTPAPRTPPVPVP
ncbi:hypothetical protein [Frigoriglobus tundricola]|uniref:Uncharacterized protein n=1 Tax=Frigoriglobus tundricola TaxID=2774151 RepID=A0A6M5YM47_9BACT|nr:hypothetical protein [Frigoriglobus tundricola]QJW95018.1 hypothetical protein FTUN_2544 [Frigoriglobus tundricola]